MAHTLCRVSMLLRGLDGNRWKTVNATSPSFRVISKSRLTGNYRVAYRSLQDYCNICQGHYRVLNICRTDAVISIWEFPYSHSTLTEIAASTWVQGSPCLYWWFAISNRQHTLMKFCSFTNPNIEGGHSPGMQSMGPHYTHKTPLLHQIAGYWYLPEMWNTLLSHRIPCWIFKILLECNRSRKFW